MSSNEYVKPEQCHIEISCFFCRPRVYMPSTAKVTGLQTRILLEKSLDQFLRWPSKVVLGIERMWKLICEPCSYIK
jgi:hypothetical protein